MTKEEILNYIRMAKSKSVCVNRCLSVQYPGYVREITIMKDNILKVEFTQYGYDEGGVCVKIYYNEFDNLISEMERYMGVKVEDWENASKKDCYPDLGNDVNFEETVKKLKIDLKNKAVKLPENGIEYKFVEGYWKDIADGKIEI